MYLGVLLNSKLSYANHITRVRRKPCAALRALYPLICGKSKMNEGNKIEPYKMIIRPIMLYGSPIWGNTCKYNINKLQIIQNKCLRMATNANLGTKTADLHKKLNIPTISQVIYNTTKKFYADELNLDILSNSCKMRHSDAPFKMKYKLPQYFLQ